MKIFVLISLIFRAGVDGLCVEWRDVAHPSELLLYPMEPVGIEGSGQILYLCRANHKGHWTPGKLEITEDSAHCTLSYGWKVYSYTKFQVLWAPPGVLSWLPVSRSDNVPNTAVIGGSDEDFPVLNICRVQHEKNILPGKYAKKSYNGECFYAYGEREYATRQTRVELLVINAFGSMAGVNQTTPFDQLK